jgi:hypothetical protein
MTPDQIAELFKSVSRTLVHLAIENETLMAVTVLHSQTAALAIPATREVIRQRWKPVLDNLEQTTPDSIEDMLLKYKGPVQ